MTLLDSIRDAAQRMIAQRELDALMRTCRHLLSAQGEANSAGLASKAIEHYRRLPEAAHLSFFQELASGFNPDPTAVLSAAERYAASPTAEHLVNLFNVSEPPRQELLRRLNRAPGGTAAIVQLRRTLLKALVHHAELAAVEADLLHLLSSWFNPGFLEMQQVDWASPARLLEKIIQHEAVHAIDGWDDLRRRLQSDRRCFAFFHPQLPGEPLIFVEVALLEEVPPAVGPLIEKKSEPEISKRFKVAAFYSISNCQPGLRGVSLGNFLIKRVAERLKTEFPSIKTFCTLSPIPGFVHWLDADAEATAVRMKAPLRERWELARKELKLGQGRMHDRLEQQWHPWRIPEEQQKALLALASIYLREFAPLPEGDAVAKFHLNNGARLQRINWAADLSRNGLRQSCGLMVNYLYDLERVEEYHQRFLDGVVVHSQAVARLA
ncbi:MAG: malonyl-CoA decarboxylase domain-containing protein [Burkholderiaceae bacterium]